MFYKIIYQVLGKEYRPDDKQQRLKETQITQAVLVLAALAAVVYTIK